MYDMQQRKVIARGFYQPPGGGWRIFQPGEDIHVPASFKARWLEPSGYDDAKAEPVKRTRRKKAEPEVTEETESSDDDAS